MMRDDPKRLEGAAKLDAAAVAALAAALQPYQTRHQDLSRRAQALLAAAGEDGPARRWYVIRVAPQADFPVDNLLGAVGIERWLPVEKRAWKRPHSQKLWVQERPFLPGYLFVRVLSCDELWSGLRSLRGVVGVLCGALGPLPVDDDKFMRFKAKQSHVEEDVAAYAKLFAKGQMVRIDRGPFASFPGIMDRDPEGETGQVIVSLFGRDHVVSVPLADLAKSA